MALQIDHTSPRRSMFCHELRPLIHNTEHSFQSVKLDRLQHFIVPRFLDHFLLPKLYPFRQIHRFRGHLKNGQTSGAFWSFFTGFPNGGIIADWRGATIFTVFVNRMDSLHLFDLLSRMNDTTNSRWGSWCFLFFLRLWWNSNWFCGRFSSFFLTDFFRFPFIKQRHHIIVRPLIIFEQKVVDSFPALGQVLLLISQVCCFFDLYLASTDLLFRYLFSFVKIWWAGIQNLASEFFTRDFVLP